MLSGLSSAQHKWELAATTRGGLDADPNAGVEEDAEEAEANFEEPAASWSVSPYLDEVQVFDEQDRIVPLHPVYAIPSECVSDIKAYFDAKQGF